MMGYDLGYNMMGTWLGGVLMAFFGLLLVAGLVLLVIWATRTASGDRGPGDDTTRGAAPNGSDGAIAIARRRLASGEITTDQFDEIMRALGG